MPVEDLLRQCCVLPRIDRIQAAAHDRDGARVRAQGTAMRGGVYAKRQPAGDDEPRLRQVLRELRGSVAAECGRITAADDRELRQTERHGVACDVQHQRRVWNLRQQRRVFRGAPGDELSIRCGVQPATVAFDPRAVGFQEGSDRGLAQPDGRQR